MLPTVPVLPEIVPFLAAAMAVSAFLLARSMRLITFVNLFRIQSVVLALYAATLAFILGHPELLVSAALIVMLKVVLIPVFLLRSARRVNVSQRLGSYVRPATAGFLAALLIAGGFYAAYVLPFEGAAYLIVAASCALALIGFLLLITRKDLVGQGAGFLTLENGIFTFGLALTNGMPLLIEIGIVFDVLIGSILMLTLLTRAQHEYASSDTDHLRHLVG